MQHIIYISYNVNYYICWKNFFSHIIPGEEEEEEEWDMNVEKILRNGEKQLQKVINEWIIKWK